MTRINITLPEEIHKQAKLKALMSNNSLKEFIVQALELKVKQDEVKLHGRK